MPRRVRERSVRSDRAAHRVLGYFCSQTGEQHSTTSQDSSANLEPPGHGPERQDSEHEQEAERATHKCRVMQRATNVCGPAVRMAPDPAVNTERMTMTGNNYAEHHHESKQPHSNQRPGAICAGRRYRRFGHTPSMPDPVLLACTVPALPDSGPWKDITTAGAMMASTDSSPQHAELLERLGADPEYQRRREQGLADLAAGRVYTQAEVDALRAAQNEHSG